MNLIRSNRFYALLFAIGFSSVVSAKEFCELSTQVMPEKVQDAMFLDAMFEADYIFRGRLFTFYNERCDGEICAFDGLVFKVLEQIDNWLNPYEETSWVEDCERLQLHQMQWRRDKDVMFFEINKEYLLLGRDTPQGMVIFGSRGGMKVKELQMRYELERIGRK